MTEPNKEGVKAAKLRARYIALQDRRERLVDKIAQIDVKMEAIKSEFNKVRNERQGYSKP